MLLRFIIGKSKKISLPGFQQFSIFDVVSNFFKHIKNANLNTRSSAISFNFAMAIPPAIIFLFTLIPLLPINKSLINELYELIHNIIPDHKNYIVINTFLDDLLNNPRGGLLSFGFIFSLFFSSNAIMGIMRAFDKTSLGFVKRKGLEKRLIALKITLVSLSIFILCLALLIMQGKVLEWLHITNDYLKTIIINFRWVLIFLLIFFIISYLYRAAPSVVKKWHFFTPGSVLATILMLFFAIGFSWWASNMMSYTKLYGSIGTILIILILVFLNSFALLIGFELNASIYDLQHRKTRRN